jgi:methyl-accepting chemotaxis protein
MELKMNTERPPIYRRQYLVNTKLQFRIALAMVVEVALITTALSLILIYLNNYYIGLITYFIGAQDAQKLAFHDVSRQMWYFLVGGVLFSSIIFSLIGIYISHKIAGPLVRLKKNMELIRNGIYFREIRFRKGDQLHDVADTFNEMAVSLDVRREIDLLYLERVEKIFEQTAENIGALKNSAERKPLIAQVNELRTTLEDFKAHKTYVWNQADDDPTLFEEPKYKREYTPASTT